MPEAVVQQMRRSLLSGEKFASRPLVKTAYACLGQDDQLQTLSMVAERLATLIELRRRTLPADDPIQSALGACWLQLLQQHRQRKIEVTTLACQAFVDGQVRTVRDEDEVDMTIIQECLDAEQEASWWLDVYRSELDYLDLSAYKQFDLSTVPQQSPANAPFEEV